MEFIKRESHDKRETKSYWVVHVLCECEAKRRSVLCPVSMCLAAVVPISPSDCISIAVWSFRSPMQHEPHGAPRIHTIIHACSWLHDAQNMVLQAKRWGEWIGPPVIEQQWRWGEAPRRYIRLLGWDAGFPAGKRVMECVSGGTTQANPFFSISLRYSLALRFHPGIRWLRFHATLAITLNLPTFLSVRLLTATHMPPDFHLFPLPKWSVSIELIASDSIASFFPTVFPSTTSTRFPLLPFCFSGCWIQKQEAE